MIHIMAMVPSVGAVTAPTNGTLCVIVGVREVFYFIKRMHNLKVASSCWS